MARFYLRRLVWRKLGASTVGALDEIAKVGTKISDRA